MNNTRLLKVNRLNVTLAILVAYMFLFSCSTQKNPTSTRANPSPTSTATTTTASTKPSPIPSNTNELSEGRVEAAVKKAFGRLQQGGQMASGANVRVIGIQELPGSNAAKADLELTNALFLQDDMLSGHWEVGKGGFGGRMVYNKKRIRIENCTAMLKHYTNGRWLLESLDTHSVDFGIIPVNVGLE
jgi:hypothetical protein